MVTPAGAPSLESLVEQIERAEQLGCQSVWVPSVRSFDTLITFALAGQRTQRVELGSFVIPTYPRHPAALAEQALTVQAASGNRLALGIGLSHRVTMEGMLGFNWDRPIGHLREYLTCLRLLLTGQPAQFEGQEYTLRGFQINVPGAEPPPILVAALGPQMLKLTGQLADGTAVWMGGARYLAEQAVPIINEAAAAAGRGKPRVVAGLPFCVTDRPDEARAAIARAFERYGQLPSYRAVLDREGAAGPADVSLVGNEAELLEQVQRYREIGVTDLVASVFVLRGDDRARADALVKKLASAD
jgi:F420-dependent oxidoreductase-like protein